MYMKAFSLFFLLLSLCSVSQAGEDKLFYGVWGREGDFRAIWGNIFITPQKIYWSRKDHTYLKYDIDRYLCSSDYIVDYRGTGKSVPGEYSKIYENDDRTYTFARFRLIDKQCDYSKVYNSHISKDIAFIQLATPSNNRGGLVGIRTYRSNGMWMGNYSAIKIHHYRK